MTLSTAPADSPTPAKDRRPTATPIYELARVLECIARGVQYHEYVKQIESMPRKPGGELFFSFDRYRSKMERAPLRPEACASVKAAAKAIAESLADGAAADELARMIAKSAAFWEQNDDVDSDSQD